ncbi:hypothetical protein BT96DRAFT_937544 [Gymnopus androsaceus JB14]|uniref:Uncharacterized protein n=1 Tax=Gymnopus androsaceus JB14 TaxID=1447944 RepID=A0A6A4HZD2_9AGAR|nr:hypothetical protein BT96DRAFT_937544 [Gymnopus androsaceus JB14]
MAKARLEKIREYRVHVFKLSFLNIKRWFARAKKNKVNEIRAFCETAPKEMCYPGTRLLIPPAYQMLNVINVKNFDLTPPHTSAMKWAMSSFPHLNDLTDPKHVCKKNEFQAQILTLLTTSKVKVINPLHIKPFYDFIILDFCGIISKKGQISILYLERNNKSTQFQAL